MDGPPAHALAELYLSVGYGADQNFQPEEHEAAVTLLTEWFPDLEAAEADGIIRAAWAATRSGLAASPEVLAHRLAGSLDPELRRHVLSDLGRVARADGHLSESEASVIARVRAAWGH